MRHGPHTLYCSSFEYAALGRVSRAVRAAQRSAISNSPQLLVAAALNSDVLTKSRLMGWFALQSAEADTLPRTKHKRLAGGFYFLYRQPAFERVLGTYLGNAKPKVWEERLRLRQVKHDRSSTCSLAFCLFNRMRVVDLFAWGSDEETRPADKWPHKDPSRERIAEPLLLDNPLLLIEIDR